MTMSDPRQIGSGLNWGSRIKIWRDGWDDFWFYAVVLEVKHGKLIVIYPDGKPRHFPVENITEEYLMDLIRYKAID